MDRDSVDRLRFDRRLQRRRDWHAEGEYESHVEALPDVSDKMVRGSDGEEAEASEAGHASPATTAAEPSPEGFSIGGAFPNPAGSSKPS